MLRFADLAGVGQSFSSEANVKPHVRDTLLMRDRLLCLLSYDPESGDFVCLQDVGSRAKAGALAGWLTPAGYRHIRIDRVAHSAHRLAWLYVYGEWPDGHVDHIDHCRSNNRIANLRVVDDALNGQNRRGPDSDSTTGYLGVTPQRGRFQAQIRAFGQYHYLGLFDTAEEASAAYTEAKKELHRVQG